MGTPILSSFGPTSHLVYIFICFIDILINKIIFIYRERDTWMIIHIPNMWNVLKFWSDLNDQINNLLCNIEKIIFNSRIYSIPSFIKECFFFTFYNFNFCVLCNDYGKSTSIHTKLNNYVVYLMSKYLNNS